MDIPNEALKLMCDKITEMNGRFHDPDYFFNEKENDAIDRISDMKSINGNPLKGMSDEEFADRREEQFCILFADDSGNIEFEQCGSVIKKDEKALGGGMFPQREEYVGFRPIVEFHNHPLYRENIHNEFDLTSALYSYFGDDSQISCIGMMRYDGYKDVFCISPRAEKFRDIKQKTDAMWKEYQSLERDLKNLSKEYDAKYGNIYSESESGFKIRYKQLEDAETEKIKSIIHSMQSLDDEANTIMASLLDNDIGISHEKWNEMIKSGREISEKEGISILYPINDKEFDAITVDTEASIKEMDKVFKEQYGEWLEIERFACPY